MAFCLKRLVVSSKLRKSMLKQIASVHSEAVQTEICVERGLPVLTIPLPSRREKCQFVLRPVGATVGDLLQDIQKEDGGIDRATIYTTSGVRVSKSTKLGDLLMSDFKLVINSDTYNVPATKHGAFDSEHSTELDNAKSLIYTMYTTLNAEEHALGKEKRLAQELEQLKLEIAPLEKEYILPDVKDRSFLISFYKGSKKKQFDVIKYNDLRDQIAQIELDLKRLRDPLALHLPILPPRTPEDVKPRE
ncbi:calcium uniporter protein, mitochondrial-like isoform X2 [Convolutriloba macropyga]|uniref:calcium uniporter protein, mitochondrial-like isoform X2 n=1 Tax=Convolutriloba macropyga TaxID=536237 RepID=UPI003F520869